MALQVQYWPVDRLIPYARNSRTHSDEQVAQIVASMMEFGWTSPILADGQGVLIAGEGRLRAARKLGMTEVPVIVLDHLTETQRRALVIADNKLALNAGWDEQTLRSELAALRADQVELLDVTGFSDAELQALLAEESAAVESAEPTEEDVAPPEPVNPVTRPGDVWLIGKHRLICGDCRDANVIRKLFEEARANVAITSPPYASQREYDKSSGFTPIPPETYVEWYRSVAAGIEAVLAPDGSYFLNIKEHAEDGERSLYVKDLVLAHKRAWAWRFVDEFCWRKTDNGVPGGWNNRFKNAWEPVFHFCKQQEIKFRPAAVSHASDDCIVYSPDNPKSRSGSGLLGCGEGREAARATGLARPSNVVECKTESSQGSHSAPFPRALVEFFLKAFTDAGDVVYDPFMGSGTTMAAAHVLSRAAYGCEISPAYCDVIVRRLMALTGEDAILAETGERFTAVARQRGVSLEEAVNPKQSDGRAIKHKDGGLRPHYGSK